VPLQSAANVNDRAQADTRERKLPELSVRTPCLRRLCVDVTPCNMH
jgi:hypothetical protein